MKPAWARGSWTSSAQRKHLPDPGIPYPMISLTELEHIVAPALVDGSGATFRAVIAPQPDGAISPNDAMKTRFADSRRTTRS